jgi:hypothetical protein
MLELGALQLFFMASFGEFLKKTCLFIKKIVTFGLLFDQNVT